MNSRFCAFCGSALEWTHIESYDVVTGDRKRELQCRPCRVIPTKHFLCFVLGPLALAIAVAWLAD